MSIKISANRFTNIFNFGGKKYFLWSFAHHGAGDLHTTDSSLQSEKKKVHMCVFKRFVFKRFKQNKKKVN